MRGSLSCVGDLYLLIDSFLITSMAFLLYLSSFSKCFFFLKESFNVRPRPSRPPLKPFFPLFEFFTALGDSFAFTFYFCRPNGLCSELRFPVSSIFFPEASLLVSIPLYLSLFDGVSKQPSSANAKGAALLTCLRIS